MNRFRSAKVFIASVFVETQKICAQFLVTITGGLSSVQE